MTITVVIPTYKRPEMLKRAMESAKDADEVLVYDDTITETGSPAFAINEAIEHATSDYLVVLDDDDFLLPGAIQRMKDGLSGDLVFSDLYLADSDSVVRGMWSYADRPTDPLALIEYVRVNRMNPIPMLGPWRLSWLRENGLRFIRWEGTGYADDCRTCLEWMKHAPEVVYAPGPFYVYRQHDGQHSSDGVERAKYLERLDVYLKGEGIV